MNSPNSESTARGLDRMLTLAIVLCAVGAVVFAVRSAVALWRPSTTARRVAVIDVPEWRTIADSGQLIGNTDAPVVVTVFSDYQCPYCAKFDTTLARVVAERRPNVSLRVRHLPLTGLHAFALGMAVQAECAGLQGRFEAYHGALFAHQRNLEGRSAADVAREAGVGDMGAFTLCVDSQLTLARVKRDIAVAGSLHLNATPTVLVNGALLSGGAPPPADIRRIVDSVMASAGARH